MQKPELALSVQQPWAWLLVHGVKDCENRTWALPRSMWGKRVYVHAGLIVDDDSCRWICRQDWIPQYAKDASIDIEIDWTKQWLGGLVGEVTLCRDVTEYDSLWFFGPHGWLVAGPVAYDRMIPCKGKLRFFKPELPQVEGQ